MFARQDPVPALRDRSASSLAALNCSQHIVCDHHIPSPVATLLCAQQSDTGQPLGSARGLRALLSIFQMGRSAGLRRAPAPHRPGSHWSPAAASEPSLACPQPSVLSASAALVPQPGRAGSQAEPSGGPWSPRPIPAGLSGGPCSPCPIPAGFSGGLCSPRPIPAPCSHATVAPTHFLTLPPAVP